MILAFHGRQLSAYKLTPNLGVRACEVLLELVAEALAVLNVPEHTLQLRRVFMATLRLGQEQEKENHVGVGI